MSNYRFTVAQDGIREAVKAMIDRLKSQLNQGNQISITDLEALEIQLDQLRITVYGIPKEEEPQIPAATTPEPVPTPEDLNPIPAPPAATAAVAKQPATEQLAEEAEPVAMAAS